VNSPSQPRVAEEAHATSPRPSIWAASAAPQRSAGAPDDAMASSGAACRSPAAALAAQMEGRGDVAVCLLGDGAAAEGEFHEALNIASVWTLPIVFVCENNQYAANNAVAVQHPRVDIAAHAGAYTMPGVIVDGNDALEVHAATGDAVARARRGDWTSLLECQTYRWRFHAMRATVAADTRPPDEIAAWRARDPIARLEQHLLARGLVSNARDRAMRARVKADLDEAVAFARPARSPIRRICWPTCSRSEGRGARHARDSASMTALEEAVAEEMRRDRG